MSRLIRVFQVLETAGLKLLPVPGTTWYRISDGKGCEVFLKEKEIVSRFGEVEEEEVRRCFLNLNWRENTGKD